MTAPSMLDVTDLVGGYGTTQVLHGVSIRVAAGGVTALLGANGAGKTTLMKTVAGVNHVRSDPPREKMSGAGRSVTQNHSVHLHRFNVARSIL